MNSQTIKVAFADDHVGVREGLVSLLNKQENIRVIADAGNGEELLAMFGRLDSLPDVAILDINMPVMNGYEAAALIREKYPSIKTIAFSMHSDEYNIIKMIKSGAVGYLFKGAHSVADISTAIRDVVAMDYYYPGIGKELFDKATNTVLPDFTAKENQFLQLCCEGLTNRQIADKMSVSYRTVEHYFESLSKKLNVCCRVELVAFALKKGLISQI